MQKLAGRWLLAVSTGPDSMALLGKCLENEMEIGVAFVNYHQRQQAESEEAFLKEYCEKKKIPLYIKNDPFEYKGNFEARAREYRYAFFQEIIEKEKYDGLLLAHQEDDVLETYFMQEEKGITPSYYGLRSEGEVLGIPFRRPLLSYTKKELEEYCQEKDIPYFIDETNFDKSYTRNRIREEIVSKLSEKERKEVLLEIEKKNAVLKERACRIDAYLQAAATSAASTARRRTRERSATCSSSWPSPG